MKLSLKLKYKELEVFFAYAENIRKYLLQEKKETPASLAFAEINTELDSIKQLEKRILLRTATMESGNKAKSFEIKAHEGYLLLKYQECFHADVYTKAVLGLHFTKLWK